MSEVENIETWDDLLALDDTEYKIVQLTPTKSVRMGSVSAARMLQWFEDQKDEEKVKTNGLVLVAESLVDSEGKRIGKVADMLKLRDKNPESLDKLRAACIELNRLEVKGAERPNGSGETTVASTSTGDSPTDLRSA